MEPRVSPATSGSDDLGRGRSQTSRSAFSQPSPQRFSNCYWGLLSSPAAPERPNCCEGAEQAIGLCIVSGLYDTVHTAVHQQRPPGSTDLTALRVCRWQPRQLLRPHRLPALSQLHVPNKQWTRGPGLSCHRFVTDRLAGGSMSQHEVSFGAHKQARTDRRQYRPAPLEPSPTFGTTG